MRIGVVFPQTELGGDAGAVRAYARGVQELGFSHVLVYDHVVGADPAAHPGWNGPYDVHTTFHEPFVLFGYLAALTSLELVTGIIILPQRQTALVAKQAAEVDLLTDGNFRLGVGIGWNEVEYEALGQDFRTRGRRMDEQIALLRRLWTEPSVTFRRHLRPRSPGRDWRRCRCSARSRCGSAPSLPAPTSGRAAWPTAGSRRCHPGPASTTPGAMVDEAARAAGRDPAAHRPGGPGQLARRPRRTGRAAPAVAGRRRDARVRQHHGRRPGHRR